MKVSRNVLKILRLNIKQVMMSGKKQDLKMLQGVNDMEQKLNELYGKIAETLNQTIPEIGIKFQFIVKYQKMFRKHIFIIILQEAINQFIAMIYLIYSILAKMNTINCGINYQTILQNYGMNLKITDKNSGRILHLYQKITGNLKLTMTIPICQMQVQENNFGYGSISIQALCLKMKKVKRLLKNT